MPPFEARDAQSPKPSAVKHFAVESPGHGKHVPTFCFWASTGNRAAAGGEISCRVPAVNFQFFSGPNVCDRCLHQKIQSHGQHLNVQRPFRRRGCEQMGFGSIHVQHECPFLNFTSYNLALALLPAQDSFCFAREFPGRMPPSTPPISRNGGVRRRR